VIQATSMKALFVGLGSIGQRHLRNLQRISPEIEVLAVRHSRISPVLTDTNDVLPEHNLQQHYKLTEIESLEQALSLKPDLVFVTNPSSLHCEVAMKALDSGAYIFIEKPLSDSWNGINELLNHANSIKRIYVGFQYRFHPALNLLDTLIKKNVIGNLVGARLVNGEYMPGWHPYEDYRNSYAARRELGGGAIVTQIHDFDYAIWLFGMPKFISAFGGHLSTLEVDVEDSVQILMNTPHNGTNLPISISLDYLHWPPKRGITIVGEDGTICCDLIKNIIIFNNRLTQSSETYNFEQFDRNQMFIDELKNFLDFAAGKANPAVDLNDGMKSLQVALAAKKALDTNSVIAINEDHHES
jgi:predicted dehydrogenase